MFPEARILLDTVNLFNIRVTYAKIDIKKNVRFCITISYQTQERRIET